MLRNGIKRENLDKINVEYNNNKLKGLKSVSNDNYLPKSVKEINHITHTATSDRKRAPFAMPLKNPYWDENHLWRDANLIYSYKNPEDCLSPPLSKNDKTIRFNSRFESGNLLYAYQLNPDVYHCILEYDHSAQSQCQWFYFQMSNIKTAPNSNRKTTIYISGFNKASGVFSTGSKVFMYSERLAKEKNIGWFRTGTNYAYGTISSKSDENRINESRILDIEATNDTTSRKKGKNKNHKLKRSTLQFEITFPYDDDVVYLCYAQPYTFTDLNLNITNWIRSAPSLITKSVLCKTNGGKDCPLLTITAPNSPSNVTKKCIFLTARIHPGEPNGSIVLHGLIDYLLSKQPLTNFLLDHFIFKIVPMVNIDGVIEGYYRVGLEGEDLNRVWNQPDPKKHPVVFNTKNLIHEMDKKHGIAAYIDFHGHSREHGTFAYGCPWEDNEGLPTTMINKEKVLPKIIASLCDAFSFEKCVFSIPQKRKDASRCVVRRELGVVNSFTIESSFGGITSGIWGNSLYNEFVWKEIGAKIGESLFHLFSEPSSQTLKTAENAIASSFPVIRPVSATKRQNAATNNTNANEEVQAKIEKKPEPKKKQNFNDKNKVVIAIDTQDGIRVISTDNQAPGSSTQQQRATENQASGPNSALGSRMKQSGTVIQKVDQTQPIESIYTLKITDLSSYSSSSSYASSARVKKNPRIKMNKKSNLNSTLNQNSELKQDQISASTSASNINLNLNCRSNLSQRSNAAICSTNSRLNDSKIFSSSSNINIIPTASPISQENENEISTSKTVEIHLTQSQNQDQNSILIPNSKEGSQNSKRTQISKENSNPNLNANENQKSNSGPNTARVSRMSKSNPVSTAQNQNTNSNSESTPNAPTVKNNPDIISNKIIKPNIPLNSNANRNSNPKLISKPNTNTTTKVSIISNLNSTSNAVANSKPAPPSNAAAVHNPRPNPSSNANLNSNQNAKPNPPSNPPSSSKQNPHSSTAAKQNQQANSKPSTPPNTDSNQRPITPSNSTVNQRPNPPPNPAANSNSKPNPHSSTSIKQNQASKQNQQSNAAQQQPPAEPAMPPTAATQKQNQPQNQTATQKPAQQPIQEANQKPSKPSNPQPQSQKQQQNQPQNQAAPQKQSQQQNKAAPQKQSQQQNQAVAQKQSQAVPQKQSQLQNPTATQKQNQQQSQAVQQKQNQKQNQTSNAASNQKPTQPQQAATTKQTPPSNQKPSQQQQPPSAPTTATSKANQAPSNQKQSTQPQPQLPTATSKTKPPQNQPQKQNQTQPQPASAKPTPPSNSNQTQSVNKQDKQKTVTNPPAKPSSPTKTNQNQTSNNRNENQPKANSNANQDLTPDLNSKQKQTINNSNSNANITITSNNNQSTKISQVTNLSPIKKPTDNNYYYDDLSSNSYLSTQSDSNSFGFLNQEDNFVSDNNLMNYSTATFNSSSTYKSPTKSIKLTTQEKTQQKVQAVQQQKAKPSQNSKSPKRK